METLVAQDRLHATLQLNTPSVRNTNLSIGDEVFIYREFENHHRTGPDTITRIDEKQVHVDKKWFFYAVLKNASKAIYKKHC